MKTTLLIALAAVSISAMGEDVSVVRTPETAETGSKNTVAPKKQSLEELLNSPASLKKSGGWLDVPAQGTAVFLFDTRPGTAGACEQFKEVFGNITKMNVVLEKTQLNESECPVNTAKTKLSESGAAYILAVTECLKGGSPLAVFPDDRVVIVNAALLKDDVKDPLQPEIRVLKELWRGLGIVSGIGYAPYPNDVCQPAYSVAELDALEYQVMQPMHMQKMFKEMERFGVKRARRIPYRIAVVEGWAPAPTNEYQEIVYNEVKTLISNRVNKANAPAAK